MAELSLLARHCAGRKIQDVIDWADSRHPGIVDEFCSRDFITSDSPRTRTEPRVVEQSGVASYQPDGSRERLPTPIEVSVSEFVTDVLGFELDEYIWLAHKEDDGTPEGRFVQDKAVRVGDLIEPKDEYCGYSPAELCGAFDFFATGKSTACRDLLPLSPWRRKIGHDKLPPPTRRLFACSVPDCPR